MIDFNLLFFDISTGEIFIILLMVFIVFGPSKIPEMAKKVGRGIYEVKRASNEIKREIDSEVRRIERDVSIKKDKPNPVTEARKKEADEAEASNSEADN